MDVLHPIFFFDFYDQILIMMILSAFDFLNFSFTDLLDIFLIALVIFYAFKSIRGTSAMNILIAIITIFFAKVIVSAFGMKMMTELLSVILDVGSLALIVIFQPEIRRFLMHLGQKYMIGKKGSRFFRRLFGGSGSPTASGDTVKEIAEACNSMSESKTGALIVIPGMSSMDSVIETGDRIDAIVNRRLLINLFFKNSPLHDGAVIVSGNRIEAARCTLPMSERDLPPQFGMRHKAAAGISELTDASVVVVSEETGNITFFKDGSYTEINNLNELKLLLSEAMK